MIIDPILVKILTLQETYKGQFWFDRRMLHKPRVKECIEEAWNSCVCLGEHTVAARISVCRKALSQWKKVNNTNSLDNI